VIDASAIPQIDSTAADMLGELQSDLKNRGVTLGLAELHTDARALLERSGVVEKIGPGMIFEGMEDALDAYETKYGRNDGQPTGSVEIKPDDHVRTGGKNGQA
jgi:SulP family sulfate permease